jgi:uncharacterized protein
MFSFRSSRTVFLVIAVLLGWSGRAVAEGFHCETPQEGLPAVVCADPEMRSQDAAIFNEFDRILRDNPDAMRPDSVVLADQLNWLNRRSECRVDAACLRAVYTDRMQALGLPVLDAAAVRAAQAGPDKAAGSPAETESVSPPAEGSINPPASEASRADGSGDPNSIVTAIIVGVLLFGLVTTVAVFSARHSQRKYGYAVFMNWNVALWLVGLLALRGAAYASTIPDLVPTLKFALVALCAVPWLIAVIRNIRRTSLLFGLWISPLQATVGIAAVFIGLFIYGSYKRDRHHGPA